MLRMKLVSPRLLSMILKQAEDLEVSQYGMH